VKAGDMVRFHRSQLREPTEIDWKHGLLIEYNTWEKVARILYEGKVISVRAATVTLAKNGRASLD